MNLTINTSEWLRGKSGNFSYLKLPRSNLYCCLGLLGRECGIPDDALEHRTMPDQVPDEFKNNYPHDLVTDPDLQLVIANVNDAMRLSEEERRAFLTELFSTFGVTLTFNDNA